MSAHALRERPLDHLRDGAAVSVCVRASTRGDATVLHVGGEVDVTTADGLRRAVAALAAADVGTVVVDLTAVTFLDATGLGVLAGARRTIAARGGRLRVVVGDPAILRVFRITGMTRLFDVCRTLDAALAGAWGASSRASCGDGDAGGVSSCG